jgi:uncharacterized protein (TIGR03118 family)
MRNWFHQARREFSGAPAITRRHSCRPVIESLEDRSLPSGGYLQTNLTSNLANTAANPDSHLVNAWGLAYGPSGPWWVADAGSGASTLYKSDGTPLSLVVPVPPATGTGPGSPTGIVFNSAGSGFKVTEGSSSGSAVFIFATLDGTISGWAPGVDPNNNAIIAVPSKPGASYDGLAFDTDGIGRNLLYGADLGTGKIDVFNSSFASTTVPGGFVDPKLPSNYAPFNVQNLGGLLYVAYALKDTPTSLEDDAGPGHGFIDVFNSDGVLQQHLVQHGQLNSPWGMAMAPANFGAFSNDLLVGNNGDGTIHAYNPHTGAFVGTVKDGQGHPIVIDQLWAIKFGNGASAGPTNTLFFAAGPNNYADGLFGSLQAIPSLKHGAPVLPNLSTPPLQSFSTEQPPNTGDQNPYGVAFVPSGVATGGKLAAGDVLVSNFNANGGAQGTGTSIVQFGPNGQPSVFFQGQAGLGLTTALAVLKSGFVIVGNAPNNNSTTNPSVLPGSLLVIDKSGNLVLTITNASLNSSLVNGPWDMAVHDMGKTAVLFVSNVLSGTITRITLSIPKTGNPTVKSAVQIAHGYTTRTDPNALVVGPTGLAFDASKDTLYVASTGDNAIFSIAHAGTTTDKGMGSQLTTSALPFNGPLGLVMAPNGDLIISNGDAFNTTATAPTPNMLVEFTTAGKLVGTYQVDTGNAGAAFGIALSTDNGEVRFAAVDDNTNTLDVWTFI